MYKSFLDLTANINVITAIITGKIAKTIASALEKTERVKTESYEILKETDFLNAKNSLLSKINSRIKMEEKKLQ